MKSELILTHLGSEEKQKSVPDFFQAITIKPYLKCIKAQTINCFVFIKVIFGI